jgi:phosphatidylglycerophosphatase A
MGFLEIENAPMIISIMLAVASLVATPSTLVYLQKKDNKAAKWSAVAGMILFLLTIIATMLNNAIAGSMLLVGTILIAVCGYYFNKETCESTGEINQKKAGLVSGIVLGIGFFVTILFFVIRKRL